MSNTIRIYAAGGAGINLASRFEGLKTTSEPSFFAEVNSCYIDTSMSNIKFKKLDADKLFVYDGLDGSGKERSNNHEIIGKNTLAVLQKFPPMALNIVLHSASGGSGSVIAPTIVSELLQRGEQVVVICIGSTDSILETKNSYKTLLSYDNISKMRKTSVVTHYVQNDDSRAEVDESVIVSISLLAALYSGKHEALDSSDLKSWVSYATKTTTVPTIASLTFEKTNENIAKLDKVVSVATLATHSANTRIEPSPQYQTVGYVSNEFIKDGKNALVGDSPIHYVLSFDLLKHAYENLRKSVEENESTLAAKVNTNATFKSDFNAVTTDVGLVL
jgi:hypothetical protein